MYKEMYVDIFKGAVYQEICYQLNSKQNGPVLLCMTILRRSNCFLSSVTTDGKDGYGLKLMKGLVQDQLKIQGYACTQKIIMLTAL